MAATANDSEGRRAVLPGASARTAAWPEGHERDAGHQRLGPRHDHRVVDRRVAGASRRHRGAHGGPRETFDAGHALVAAPSAAWTAAFQDSRAALMPSRRACPACPRRARGPSRRALAEATVSPAFSATLETVVVTGARASVTAFQLASVGHHARKRWESVDWR